MACSSVQGPCAPLRATRAVWMCTYIYVYVYVYIYIYRERDIDIDIDIDIDMPPDYAQSAY